MSFFDLRKPVASLQAGGHANAAITWKICVKRALTTKANFYSMLERGIIDEGSPQQIDVHRVFQSLDAQLMAKARCNHTRWVRAYTYMRYVEAKPGASRMQSIPAQNFLQCALDGAKDGALRAEREVYRVNVQALPHGPAAGVDGGGSPPGPYGGLAASDFVGGGGGGGDRQHHQHHHHHRGGSTSSAMYAAAPPQASMYAAPPPQASAQAEDAACALAGLCGRDASSAGPPRKRLRGGDSPAAHYMTGGPVSSQNSGPCADGSPSAAADADDDAREKQEAAFRAAQVAAEAAAEAATTAAVAAEAQRRANAAAEASLFATRSAYEAYENAAAIRTPPPPAAVAACCSEPAAAGRSAAGCQDSSR